MTLVPVPSAADANNPPDADYCTNADCDFELRPPCPNCRTRVAWHQGRCHKCGVNLKQGREEQQKWQEQQRTQQSQREQETTREPY